MSRYRLRLVTALHNGKSLPSFAQLENFHCKDGGAVRQDDEDLDAFSEVSFNNVCAVWKNSLE